MAINSIARSVTNAMMASGDHDEEVTGLGASESDSRTLGYVVSQTNAIL